jgi:6-phosphogluconolactonase (cycloisomerase 2 family)
MSMVHPLSRRHFLQGTSAFVLGTALDRAGAALRSGRILAYVGTYTGAVGNFGDGEGIYAFEMDPGTGELLNGRLAAKTPSPSWIAIHPSKRYLYAVNEENDGSVSAFAIDGANGNLTPLNTVSSGGSQPAYLSLDASGRYAFVANYGSGSLAVLPVLSNGTLGAAADLRRDQGSVGSMHATDAPRGSFAISGHDAPHVHMALADPHNRFVLATDLGQDRIYVYRFDQQTGKLAANAPSTALPSGDGPRHFAFHPNGRWLYSIQEESSTIAVFDYDAQAGSLHARQTVSALPPGFAGTNFASEILVSPDGKFLYAAGRLHDTIAVFSIGGDGRLEWTGEVSTRGDYPRNCAIDPTGSFLYSCNQRSDAITSFRIDRGTGRLTFTGQYAAVASPAIIVFLA